MREGNCRASYGTIGENINVDRRTVIRNIEKLCELGYLIDTTPNCKHAPHVYIIGKTVAQNNSLGVTFCHSYDEKGVTESHWGSDTESLLGVTESHPKRDINRDSNRIRERESRAEINNKVLEICGYDLKYLSTETGKKVNDTVTQLITWGATVELIKEFKLSYWWGNSPPTLKQLIDEWSKFMTWKQNPGDRNRKDTTNGNQRTNKTGTARNTVKPRAMDEATIRNIESEIAELEQRLNIGGNPARAAT